MEISVIFLLLASVLIFWIIAKSYTSRILKKYRDMERLLLDIRDGTRSFYAEKRRAPRVKTDISAKLIEKNTEEKVSILNLSYSGALLKTTETLETGRIIELNISLPLFPRPIDVRAKVVRVAASETGSSKMDTFFKIGVNFIEMSRGDREYLIETVDFFLNKPANA